MTSGDEPQLGGQDRDDNAPMISGRGTKIIVSARGAYEARNLPALFDAMEADQRVMFRQAVIVEMMDRIRVEIEQAADSRPELLDTLTRLAQWIFEPTQENADRLYAEYLDDRLGELDPLTYRLRGLVLGARHDRHEAIGYAKDAILYIADDDVPQQPQYAIMESEVEDWIFEVGWAILHGRNAPPLTLDTVRIEALIGDVERWYRKKNLPILVQLMIEDQRAQFKHAIRQQAMWHIDKVPVDLWSKDNLEVIEQARRWVANPLWVTPRALWIIRMPHRPRWSKIKLAYAVMGNLIDTFDSFENNKTHFAGSAANVVVFVKAILDGKTSIANTDFKMVEQAFHWQIETAYAILTDQAMPPL